MALLLNFTVDLIHIIGVFLYHNFHHEVQLMNFPKYLMAFSVFSVVAGTAFPASAVVFGFQSEYGPSNWSLETNGGDGSVDTTNAPNSITLTGSDTDTFNSIVTDYTIVAPGNGIVSFNWDYTTNDVDGPSFDPFIRLLNGVETQLTNDGGATNQSGTDSFSVVAGDTFGFRINTIDDSFGEALTIISSFEGPETRAQAVPFETEGAMGLVAIGGYLGYRRLKKRKQTLIQNADG